MRLWFKNIKISPCGNRRKKMENIKYVKNKQNNLLNPIKSESYDSIVRSPCFEFSKVEFKCFYSVHTRCVILR